MVQYGVGLFATAPRFLTYAAHYAWYLVFEFAIASLPTQFLYRWTLVCRDREMSALSYGAALAAAVGYAVVASLLQYATDEGADGETARRFLQLNPRLVNFTFAIVTSGVSEVSVGLKYTRNFQPVRSTVTNY